MTALLDQWAIFDHPAVGFDPHPAQLDIIEDRHRHKVVVGGRRLGKSLLGAHRLLPEVFLAHSIKDELKKQGKRREFHIVGPTYNEGEKEFRVFWNLLKRLEIPMDTPGSYNLPMSGQMHVSLWDGVFQVHVRSAVDPERLVGEELTGVIMAEAAKLKPIIWTKYIRPMLLDQKGWSFFSSTPEGKNWYYDLYVRGQKTSDPDWQSWRIPSWRNTHLFGPTKDEDVNRLLELSRKNPSVEIHDIAKAYDLTIDPEILDIAGELTVEAFKQEIGADFTEYVGKVFRDFDTEYHCGTLTYQRDWETFACADFGMRNPNVWLLGQIGPNGEINFLDEVYTEGQHPVDFAKEIRRRGLNPPELRDFYPDPARPDTVAILEEELMLRGRLHTGGDLKVRLDLIRAALKKGVTENYGVYKDKSRKWRPQMMFDWKCGRSINDFEIYKYAERKDEHQETSTERFENPLKLNDHAPEAVGRFMAGRFGERSQAGQRGETRVSRMSMGRGKRSIPAGPHLLQQGKPERYMRLTDHEESGYEYKQDSERTYYD